MKIALLTSTSYRHKFIASQLNSNHEVVLIVTEDKSRKIEDASTYSTEDQSFLRKHFEDRGLSEQEYFGEHSKFPEAIPHLSVPHGDINKAYVYNLVKELDPDMVMLFGTSIIRGELLKSYDGKMINLHLGLSPYYKGSATNLFPVADGNLECVGSTIHVVSAQVDAGDILHQVRPELEHSDTLHDLGNKVILESGKVIGELIESYYNGDLNPVKQEKYEGAKICRIKNVTPDLTRRAYQNIESGAIKKFLEDRTSRLSITPIVDYFNS
ncbi:MAG: formyltransferase family protein [Nonlabens sp.]